MNQKKYILCVLCVFLFVVLNGCASKNCTSLSSSLTAQKTNPAITIKLNNSKPEKYHPVPAGKLFGTAQLFDRKLAKLDDAPVDVNIIVADSKFRLLKPVDGEISSFFGMRKHPTKKKKAFHGGIDIRAKRGTDVMAGAVGVVTFSGNLGGGYGKTIEITHPNGIVTRYAHLDKVFLPKGTQVHQGQRIGLVGRTGRTSGANLHLEVLVQNKRVNPVKYL